MSKRGTRLLRRLIFVVLVAVVGFVSLPLAAAQDAPPVDAPVFVVKDVNTTDFPQVTSDVSVVNGTASAEDFSIQVDGVAVRSESASVVGDGVLDRGVMFVLDSTRSTEAAFGDSARIEVLLDAVRRLADRFPGDKGLVLVSEDVDVVARLGALGPLNIDRRLRQVAPVGDADVWAGVAEANLELLARTDINPDIIILTDGPSNAGSAIARRALSAAAEYSIGIHTLAITNSELDDGFQRIARASGGAYVAVTPETVDDGIDQMIREIDQQFRITFTYPDADSGLADFSVLFGDQEVAALVPAGTRASGDNIAPELLGTDTGGFFTGRFAKLVGVALALLAAGMATYSIGLVFFDGEQTLSSKLAFYSGESDSLYDVDEEDTQSAFVKRALALTEDLAERQGVLPRVERLLDQAEVPLRPAEGMFSLAVLVGASFIIGVLLSRNLLVGIILALVAGLVPVAVLNRRAGKRRRKFSQQLPDTLQLFSGSLRAGYSFMQALEAVSQETDEPMGSELRRVSTEARLGRPVEDALDDVSDRMESDDFGWAVMAIRIQREVGGNLAELLMTVSETMVARERLRREVRSLTAEGRVSAIILAVLPLAMGGAIWLLNPDYIDTLFNDSRGQFAIGISIFMAFVGFIWMNKIIEVDI